MADNGKSAEKGEDSFVPKGHGKERYRREPEGESTGRGVIRAGGVLPAYCVLCRLPLRVKQNPQGIYLCREA